MQPDRRKPWISWVFVCALFASCATLGILQYQWIGEVSVAAGDRLRAALQVNLAQLSRDLNSEVTSRMRGLSPSAPPSTAAEAQTAVEERYTDWKKAPHGGKLLRRIGLATPNDGTVSLQMLDIDKGKFTPAEWPAQWEPLRHRMESRRGPMPGPPPGGPGDPWPETTGLVVEQPLFGPVPGGSGRGFGRTEIAWIVFELDEAYIRDTILPDVATRHLDTNAYAVEVTDRSSERQTIWLSDAKARGISETADASVDLLELRLGPFGDGGRGRGGMGARRAGGRGPGGHGPDGGRWVLSVQHRAGSLDAVVAQTRFRNLAVTGGVLLLLIATLAALTRFTRNAQRLAHMQMDFVAGVSHELRTPLTAIYTAGHNLRGRVAQNPAQVERYGEMIQQESGRLRDLVEQVLRFASANAGRVIQEPSPVSVVTLIDASVESSRCAMQSAGCSVEKHVEPGLPEVMADSLAMKHALQNLLANAVKYGAKDDPWIGISAVRTEDSKSVEIRVADHGPGIPEEEQKHIFDAFYRGRQAVQDQVHGAGLGLNLVKKIVEAHGGTIRVQSAPAQGAEFIVRIPVVPAGAAS
jgi:signal transduction histidine kinase